MIRFLLFSASQSLIVSKVTPLGSKFTFLHSNTLPPFYTLFLIYKYTESDLRDSLSQSNFFDSEIIGLRHSLSLSKKVDSDNEYLNPIFRT